MTVKNIFRRMNRGIVLAAVLVLGLIGYLVFDAATFGDEKELIKTVVTQYADAAENLIILPESARIPGKPAPDDVIKAKIDQGKEILPQYLTYSVSQYTSALDMVSDALEHIFFNNNNTCAYVMDCDFEILAINGLKKRGTNTAVGDIVMKTTITTIGSPDYIKMFYWENVTDGNGFSNAILKDGNPEIDIETHTMSNEVTYKKAVFLKESGKWKISSVGYMEFSSGMGMVMG